MSSTLVPFVPYRAHRHPQYYPSRHFHNIMADMTAYACAQCGKPTTSHCQRCSEGLDVNGEQLLPAYYCGRECQEAGWRKGYKGKCKIANDRKQIYVVGRFAQSLFYEWRRVGWQTHVEKYEMRNGKLHMYEATQQTQAYRFHAVSACSWYILTHQCMFSDLSSQLFACCRIFRHHGSPQYAYYGPTYPIAFAWTLLFARKQLL